MGIRPFWHVFFLGGLAWAWVPSARAETQKPSTPVDWRPFMLQRIAYEKEFGKMLAQLFDENAASPNHYGVVPLLTDTNLARLKVFREYLAKGRISDGVVVPLPKDPTVAPSPPGLTTSYAEARRLLSGRLDALVPQLEARFRQAQSLSTLGALLEEYRAICRMPLNTKILRTEDKELTSFQRAIAESAECIRTRISPTRIPRFSKSS